jgi:hypothetical protein
MNCFAFKFDKHLAKLVSVVKHILCNVSGTLIRNGMPHRFEGKVTDSAQLMIEWIRALCASDFERTLQYTRELLRSY